MKKLLLLAGLITLASAAQAVPIWRTVQIGSATALVPQLQQGGINISSGNIRNLTATTVRVSSMVIWADGTISTTAVAGGGGGAGDITGVLTSGEGIGGGALSGDATIVLFSTVAKTNTNQTWTAAQTYTSSATFLNAVTISSNSYLSGAATGYANSYLNVIYGIKWPDGSISTSSVFGSGGGSSGIVALPLPGGDTNYIQMGGTLQNGATFYVSSGTVKGSFILRSLDAAGTASTSTLTMSMSNSSALDSSLNYLSSESGLKLLVSTSPTGTSQNTMMLVAPKTTLNPCPTSGGTYFSDVGNGFGEGASCIDGGRIISQTFVQTPVGLFTSSAGVTGAAGLSVTYGATVGTLTITNGGDWPSFDRTSDSNNYRFNATSATVTVGQCSVFSSTSGATIGATCGGGGTPGGSSGQIQYNNGGSFGGVTGSVVTASSVTLPLSTITSSLTVVYGGGNSGNSGGVLNVYKADSVSGSVLMSVGSAQQPNQVVIADQLPVDMAFYGAGIGSLNIGGTTPGTNNHKIYDTNSLSQHLNLWNNGEVELKTADIGSGGKDITFYPRQVETVRISSMTGFTVSSTSTFKQQISVVSVRWADGSTSTSSVFGSGGGGSADGTGYAVEPSTVIFQLAKGVYLGTNTITGSAYPIASTDTIVLASGTFNTTKTFTLPAANSACRNGAGQTIQITKVDSSTGPIRIIPTGTDLISGSTRAVTLNAMSQTAQLVSDCRTTWWPHGPGIQATPQYLGFPFEGATGIVNVSSSVAAIPAYTPVPIAVTGFKFYVAGGAGGFANLGVYDSNRNLVVSTGPIAVSAFGVHTIETSPVNLPAGHYMVAFQPSNIGISVGGFSMNGGNGSLFCSLSTAPTSLVLPSVFGSGSTVGCPAIFALIAGGRTGL